jgi:hypothetical protein
LQPAPVASAGKSSGEILRLSPAAESESLSDGN